MKLVTNVQLVYEVEFQEKLELLKLQVPGEYPLQMYLSFSK